MRRILAISAVVALVLALAAFPGDAGQRKGGSGSGDRAQQIEQERVQQQDRVDSRVETREHAQVRDKEIYGHELMSKEELNQYRQQKSMMKSAKAQEQFQLRHEEKMRERALQQNKDIVPPGQGPVYRGELMSVQERNEYREELRNMKSEEERMSFMAQHQEKMDKRARAITAQSEEPEEAE